MVTAQHSVDVDRPIDEVFTFLADGTNNPRWQPRVVNTTRQGAVLELGTSFKQSMRHPLGFRVPADYRIIAFDRPRRLVKVGTSGGPIHPTETYDFVESGRGGTTVKCTIAFRPGGMARLAGPLASLLHPLFAWEASWLENARNLLEATASPGRADLAN